MDEGTPRQLSLFDDVAFYESADVEFKAARGGLPGSLWETYSAFANSNGGTIFLGIVERDDGPPEFQGVRDPDKLLDSLWSLAHNRGKVSANLLSENDVEVIDNDGKNIIRIHVRRASRNERPVFLDNDPMGKTFRRDHTGDYRCTPDEVRRMFADQAPEQADSRILSDFGWEDIDIDSMRKYRNRILASSPTHPWLLEDDLGLLRKLGGWRRDRRTGQEGLTVAGLLMFGRDEAIRAPEALPQYQLDYRERLGEEPEQRWSDRLTIDGAWESNLFQFYSRVMPRLAATIKTPFQIDPALYRYDDTSVGAALREGVVNALIHADYSGQGGIVIDR